ncbi:ATP12 chaperone protein [Croceibacterium atlanticum]|uniref:ATP12 chaperone protein n=2 Tax=Croceibacterium atlanticum TaxID=1267766 RepID=A0A0F7KTB6_9SPHN|nr:ATP12 family chaperone protein [Croceibacterium atlanticum]AKH42472.1 ATP12 chaperone protein [Croceibacterium atlanticum]
MKRFWENVTVEEADNGFRVALDGRPIRTQGGGAQIVPTRPLAEALAEEWRAQGEEVDPKSFILRDLADFAIDKVAPAPEDTIASLLPFAETDTLCYRADPEEPLFKRQEDMWEPILTACETRHAIRFERASGVIHRRQPEETLARLASHLREQDHFSLAALRTLAPLAASIAIALAALEEGADAGALFAAANCEEDWQAELWGWDDRARQDRAARLAAFEAAAHFARLARG